MNTYPYLITPHEPTRKQLWLTAFTSLLCHMKPEEAVREADIALNLCDTRWEEPEWVRCWQYAHNYPVGHRFGQDPHVEKEDGAPSHDGHLPP
ncbi:MAG: hypothetical protein RSP_09900 [Rhodanobacter sp.]